MTICGPAAVKGLKNYKAKSNSALQIHDLLVKLEMFLLMNPKS